MNLLEIPQGEEAKVEPEARLRESLGQFKALAKKGKIVSTEHQKIKSLMNSLWEGISDAAVYSKKFMLQVYKEACQERREDARERRQDARCRREEVREPQEAHLRNRRNRPNNIRCPRIGGYRICKN